MTAPLRFAYLFERFPSFVQTFVYREAAEMVRQGAEPWLVSIRRPEDPADLAAPVQAEVCYLPEEKKLRADVDQQRAQRKLSRAAHRAIARHRAQSDSQRMFEAIWLAPELRRRGIWHVHAHFGGMAARTAWWLRRLFGVSYSFTGHANDIFCETTYPVTNADIARDARFVVTETDYARRWMEDQHPPVRGRVFRVFNGIDPAGFFAREPSGPQPRILSVGRYVEKKGFDVLIDACAGLRSAGLAFSCDIIGGGPLQGPLQTQIERLGLQDTVRLLGPRSQDEVRHELARTDLFVLACQPDSEGGSDNLPTVIAEAMFSGVPCISTTLAGVPEMITHEKTGLLVAPRSATELTAAMTRLLRDRVLAAALGAAGKSFAHEQFSIEKSVERLRRLLDEHGGRRRPIWSWWW